MPDVDASSGPVVLLAGGGSGGHLYPGIAVARRLVEKRPDVTPLFACTEKEIDRVILEPTGFDWTPQPIVPPSRSVGGLLRFWQSWRATNDQLKKLMLGSKPRAVLGLGGYAAGAAVKMAGKKFGLPAGILNPDVVPGKANVFLMPQCRRVFCGFEQTLDHVPAEHRERCVVVGCPLRSELLALPDPADAARRLGLDAKLSTLVVTGASQGARTVNEGVLEAMKSLAAGSQSAALRGWQILHLAGREHADAVRAAWRATPLAERVRVVDFTPDMADVWAVADMAVSRAGAGSCAELLACGVPSILMPYPFHKDMHQRHNAQALVDAGAADLLDDQKDARKNAAALVPALEGLLFDADRRARMSTSAKAAALPHAAEAVADELLTWLDEGDP